MVSQLTPDRLVEPVGTDDVHWRIPVLEALTAVGHPESRANACFGLRGLATWGATDAAPALRRVMVREEDEAGRRVPWKTFVDPICGMIGDAIDDVGEVGVRTSVPVAAATAFPR